MTSILSINDLSKVYSSGLKALDQVNLDIKQGEIFALLGPNGAGKTTLISTVCGLVTATSGKIFVDGDDITKSYREVRKKIGLVPQELTIDMFESVWATVSFSRGLFGFPKNPSFIEEILKDLSLWEKRKDKLMTLSGGMKRRVLIAKALAHEPKLLFLDEPTAGVDVELRKDMWGVVRKLSAKGVTIILTTHYIEEAEQLADRIGVINKGRLILAEEKTQLMKKLGKKEITVRLERPLFEVPPALSSYQPALIDNGNALQYSFSSHDEKSDAPSFLKALAGLDISYNDLDTRQSSLEEIFVYLVAEGATEKL